PTTGALAAGRSACAAVPSRNSGPPLPIGSVDVYAAGVVAASTAAPTAATLGRGDALSRWFTSQTAGSAAAVSALATSSRRRSRWSNIRVAPCPSGRAPVQVHVRTETLGRRVAERKRGRRRAPGRGADLVELHAVDLGQAGADVRHPRRPVA